MSKNFFELKARDKKSIWHPYTAPSDHLLIPIKQTKGSYLIDYQGRKFIDAISSWWVNILGHSEPTIMKKIYSQAKKTDQIIFANFTHEPAIKLAETLLKCCPFPFSKVFYSDNGSTAVEVALKMSLQYWDKKRKKILALKNSYHGDTIGTMSVSHRGVFSSHFEDVLYEVDYIDLDKDANVLGKMNFKDYAAFIYEPLIQGAGGMIVYPKDIMNKLLHKAQQAKVLLIADEVMTGFGRTGTLFASEQLNVTPDFMCLSKGLTTGGLPLSTTMIGKTLVDHFFEEKKERFFYHGHSYTANPIACATANACLDILLKKIHFYKNKWNNVQKLYYNFLDRIKPYYPLVSHFRICGTILAFDIINEDKHGYTNPVGKQIKEYCFSKGVVIRPLGNTVYIMPPYCISNKQMVKIFDTLKGAIKHVGN